jgi:arylsulfatase A-like enzyme
MMILWCDERNKTSGRRRSGLLGGRVATLCRIVIALTAFGWLGRPGQLAAAEQPNFVIIFCDDLGYGDLASYGHPTIRTPNLDRMASQGMRFTDFYVAASVCTPSRAALLTGRLPIRSGMCSDTRRVLFPDSAGGLPQSEWTLAEALKVEGYRSACIGKWHLGHLPAHLPTRNGFDYYFGIPYSNDMDRTEAAPPGAAKSLEPKVEWWNVPLMRNEEVIERPADQHTITRRYTEEAVEFIRRNRARPFLLYLAHSMPHVPLFASDRFEGTSARGLYGDVVEEIDWSVGEVLAALQREGVAERTLVVFTSDNGPWLTQDLAGGSAGLLREGKGSTWEGGMRVPAIAWWPGRIQPGVVNASLLSTLDLLPTFVSMAGGRLPGDRVFDGVDVSRVMLEGTGSPRRVMFYYRGTHLYAVRHDSYKAHYVTQSAYGGDRPNRHEPPLLFHLGHDPSEKHDVASEHPDVLAGIAREVEAHRLGLESGAPQLERRIERPAGAR